MVSIDVIKVVASLPVSDDKSLDSLLGFHDATHHSEKGGGYGTTLLLGGDGNPGSSHDLH